MWESCAKLLRDPKPKQKRSQKGAKSKNKGCKLEGEGGVAPNYRI